MSKNHEVFYRFFFNDKGNNISEFLEFFNFIFSRTNRKEMHVFEKKKIKEIIGEKSVEFLKILF